jgi:hypothetical protein
MVGPITALWFTADLDRLEGSTEEPTPADSTAADSTVADSTAAGDFTAAADSMAAVDFTAAEAAGEQARASNSLFSSPSGLAG